MSAVAFAACAQDVFNFGITDRTVFGINRNALVLIIQLMTCVLGAVNAGLHTQATVTLVLGIIVASLNGMAAVLKMDTGGEQPAGPERQAAPLEEGLIARPVSVRAYKAGII